MNIREFLGIKKDQKINKIKPGHGNCCTCQTCGYGHDECVCSENIDVEICEYVEQLQETIKTLKDEIERLKEFEYMYKDLCK